MSKTALVTGVTGYIGARLVPELLAAGWQVRVLTRDRGKIADRSWLESATVIEGDADDPAVLANALQDTDIAYYLLHSMDGRPDFERRDRALARAFGTAAREAGVRRIVYLSGLHPADENLSPHLASRVEVGEILMASGVPTVVLQAAVIVGAGSASFEMLRQLTRRLPAMIGPRWLNNRIQPIAIRDVLHYLVGAASLPGRPNRTFDIGGPDVLTYRQLIQRFAAVDGLAGRLIVTVPVLTPWLASLWVGAVTRVPMGIAQPLVGSLVHEVVCREHDLIELLPSPAPLLGFDDAVRAALATPEDAELPEPGAVDPALLTAADPRWADR